MLSLLYWLVAGAAAVGVYHDAHDKAVAATYPEAARASPPIAPPPTDRSLTVAEVWGDPAKIDAITEPKGREAAIRATSAAIGFSAAVYGLAAGYWWVFAAYAARARQRGAATAPYQASADPYQGRNVVDAEFEVISGPFEVRRGR